VEQPSLGRFLLLRRHPWNAPQATKGTAGFDELAAQGFGVSDDRQLLDESQQVATFVAAKAAGWDVELHGDGVQVLSLTTYNEVGPGDTIVKAGDHNVGTYLDLSHAIERRAHPNAPLVLTLRDGNTFTLKPDRVNRVTLADNGPSGLITMTESARVSGLRTDVAFESGRGIGPSGGLAFALAVFSEISGENLARGRVIVATGAIAPDGRVRPVGYVAQKGRAAASARADIFLVPQHLVRDARRYSGRTRVIGVATFEDALAALRSQ
jgi:PDZ domain-containing protein